MARRKISANHKEELEYRILAFLRQKGAYGPTECKARVSMIVFLASLWEINLDRQQILYNIGMYDRRTKPQPAPDVPEVVVEKPLTEPLSGDIFGELEGDPDEEA